MVVGLAVKVRVGVGVVVTLNVAVTDILPAKAIWQEAAVPEQEPDQLAKVEPEAGAAVKVTLVPETKGDEAAEQDVPQLIPEGLETTVPEPVPDLETVKV